MSSASHSSFVAAVRSGVIIQPSHPARFVLSGWEETCAEYRAHTEQDKALLSAGVWFGDRFKSVAVAAHRLSLPQYDIPEFIRLQCGVANEMTLALLSDAR